MLRDGQGPLYRVANEDFDGAAAEGLPGGWTKLLAPHATAHDMPELVVGEDDQVEGFLASSGGFSRVVLDEDRRVPWRSGERP
jgi:hypothetical protein